MQDYTFESLKPLNASLDGRHRLEQSDVDIVNRLVDLIESTRRETPCPGDIIEYTDEYGIYYKNAHIQVLDRETDQFSVSCIPHVPFVFKDDEHDVWFSTGGGPWCFLAPAVLVYFGKREKLFKLFGHDRVTGETGVYFKALVNVWEYIAPNQHHPGYSTKDWAKRYISFVEKPTDGSASHYYDFINSAVFYNKEYQQWKATYKAVEFPGGSPTQTILFHYRETCVLITREEWDNLDLPLDTRFVNGIIHVKVAYGDDSHMITEYRFANTGYLDPRSFSPYERAKGTVLSSPEPEVKGELDKITTPSMMMTSK